MEISLLLVIVVGVVVLVAVSLMIGAELDTERQREIRNRVAEERRRLREDLFAPPDSELCDRCPYRRHRS